MAPTTSRPIGLVLCGGGAKGAYQMGVWKYLLEAGIYDQIGAISGVSVGDLNGVMMVQDIYEQAVDIWKSFRQQDLFVKANEEDPSLFSQERIYAWIQQGLVKWDVVDKPIEMYVCVSAKSPSLWPLMQKNFRARELLFESEYICVNSFDKKEVSRLLLASSAIPGIYPSHTIHGKEYVDGGVIDNSPVRPLLDSGYKKIIVVHLQENNEEEQAKWEKSLKGQSYPDVTFYHVYPSEPITFFDTYLINKVLTLGRMGLGYEDAQNQLKELSL